MEPGSSRLPGGVIVAAGPDVEVVFAAPGWRAALPRAETLARRAVALTLADQGATGHITVLLTDDAEIRRLNGGFRGRDKATNVLSFPAPYGALTLGDLAVSLGVLRREAAGEGRGLAAHFGHLVVHGTLHLLGHDHLAAGQAASMERAEARILRRLGLPNPWRPRWRSAA
jgi:probable rRNA maturation factor